MAHNPPRVWITDEDINRLHSEIKRRSYRWGSLTELADKMPARARQGKRVVLSPSTAEFMADALKRGAESKPDS